MPMDDLGGPRNSGRHRIRASLRCLQYLLFKTDPFIPKASIFLQEETEVTEKWNSALRTEGGPKRMTR